MRRRVGEIVDDLLSFESIDEILTDRGWEFDVDNSTDELATWFFVDSAADLDDDDVEPVTRIWVGAADDEIDDRQLEWHVIFVGAVDDSVDYVFSAESLLENLLTIEAYRLGAPAPDFDADGPHPAAASG